MNCSNQRKRIIALAANALDPDKKRSLQVHLRTCAKCREYLEEISTITENLRAVEIRSDLQASESFHHKLAARLRTQNSEPFWISALSDFRALLMSNPRTALATGMLLVGALGLLLFRPAVPPINDVSPIAAYQARYAPLEVAPSISNYQVVANHSFELLDELLTIQGTKTSPSPPIYTASTLSLAKDLE